MPEENKHITLSQLQQHIKNVLEGHLEDFYWVVAEISELKVNYSGHCYLELVEKGGANQVPKAKVNAVIWRNVFTFLDSYFTKQTSSPLSKGINVLLRVEVSYHELYGLSLVVRDIDPSYTLGEMERQRQETINRLKEEGLFDKNRGLELPGIIQRIAVVSSEKAAGYQDFMKELFGNEYGYDYRVSLFGAVMQGNEAESSVIAALDEVRRVAYSYDAVVLIRGGGAQSDLACFNSYRLCRAIAEFPLPVITGIGHDKDLSVADMIAAVSVKTPTAVARYLIDATLAVDTELTGILDYLKDMFFAAVEEAADRIDTCSLLLKERVTEAIQRETLFWQDIGIRIEKDAGAFVRGKQTDVEQKSEQLAHAVQRKIDGGYHRMGVLFGALKNGCRIFLSDKEKSLATAEAVLAGFNPERILSLGYSIAKVRGKIIRSSGEVRQGDELELRVSDGTVYAEVAKVVSDKVKSSVEK